MYTSSKGEVLDPAQMEITHIERAYAKAVKEGNKANQDALQPYLTQ